MDDQNKKFKTSDKVYAKKSLGQHFLRSERALNAIVEVGKLNKNDQVLEIGPGTGALTEKLLATGAKVLAVEKDDQLFASLKEKFQEKNLELVHEDILEFETSQLESYKLVANIPYNITGAILEKFLSAENPPERMVLLVQKEVAERVVTRNSKESILSVSVKAYGNPRYIETVKAGSFVPAPRVDSAILCVENISKEFFSSFGEKEFFRILKAGFQSKRKKLLSNLSVVLAREKVASAFQKIGLSENTRAEDVQIEEWQKLAEELI